MAYRCYELSNEQRRTAAIFCSLEKLLESAVWGFLVSVTFSQESRVSVSCFSVKALMLGGGRAGVGKKYIPSL